MKTNGANAKEKSHSCNAGRLTGALDRNCMDIWCPYLEPLLLTPSGKLAKDIAVDHAG